MKAKLVFKFTNCLSGYENTKKTTANIMSSQLSLNNFYKAKNVSKCGYREPPCCVNFCFTENKDMIEQQI